MGWREEEDICRGGGGSGRERSPYKRISHISKPKARSQVSLCPSRQIVTKPE